jgi:hypothetical protein
MIYRRDFYTTQITGTNKLRIRDTEAVSARRKHTTGTNRLQAEINCRLLYRHTLMFYFLQFTSRYSTVYLHKVKIRGLSSLYYARLLQGVTSLWFSDQNVCISHLSSLWHIVSPYHYSWFYYHNNALITCFTGLLLQYAIRHLAASSLYIFSSVISSRIEGRNGSVGVATRYGLQGPRIESRWERDFPHLSRLALGPTQTLINW